MGWHHLRACQQALRGHFSHTISVFHSHKHGGGLGGGALSLFFFNLLFILNKHWHAPVFVVRPAL